MHMLCELRAVQIAVMARMVEIEWVPTRAGKAVGLQLRTAPVVAMVGVGAERQRAE